jgi:integrase
MRPTVLLDACGRRRSPATLSSFHQGRPPRNKGQRYPADPPTVEEIIAVMHAAGDDNDAVRLRGLIVVLWRAGLRISEALALTESDLDLRRGAILVRHGKGGKRREVGMDRWAWEQLGPWLRLRLRTTLPVAALSACCAARPLAARWLRPVSARNSTARPAARVCGVGSRPTSCGTLTRSRCHVRACRCSSSSASSATPTSRSPRCISEGSTTPRSCMPSTSGRPR